MNALRNGELERGATTSLEAKFSRDATAERFVQAQKALRFASRLTWADVTIVCIWIKKA